MKLVQPKTAALGFAVVASTALVLTGCSGSGSSSSSASATPTSSSPSATATASGSATPTHTASTAARQLNPSTSFFQVGPSKINVTSGTIEGLVASPVKVTSSGQTKSGAYNLEFTVNASGKVTAATLTIGKDTYKSIGSSGAVEFGDAHPGVAVGTTTPIAVSKNGGNGSLELNFDLATSN